MNSATCEISQPVRFHRLRKFRNLEFSKLKNCSPSPLQRLQKQKIIRRQACKRENLQKENKPNNKGHKKITKLINKILVTSEILQKSLPNVWLGGFMEGQGGGFPPCILSVALHMALAFSH